MNAGLGRVRRALDVLDVLAERGAASRAVVDAVPCGGALLHLGCGEGGLLASVLPRVNRAVGVDVDAHKLAVATEALDVGGENKDRVHLVCEDLLAYVTNARRESCRSILIVETLSSRTLSSLPRPSQRALLNGALHLLEVGGKLIVKMLAADPVHKAAAARIASTVVERCARRATSSPSPWMSLPSYEISSLLRQATVPTAVDVRVLHRELHRPMPYVLLVATRRALC